MSNLTVALEPTLDQPIDPQSWARMFTALGLEFDEIVRWQIVLAASNFQRARAEIANGRDPNWGQQAERWNSVQDLSSQLLALMDDADARLHANWIGDQAEAAKIGLSDIARVLTTLRDRAEILAPLCAQMHVPGQKGPDMHKTALYRALLAVWTRVTGEAPKCSDRDGSGEPGQSKEYYGPCFDFMKAATSAIMLEDDLADSTIAGIINKAKRMRSTASDRKTGTRAG